MVATSKSVMLPTPAAGRPVAESPHTQPRPRFTVRATLVVAPSRVSLVYGTAQAGMTGLGADSLRSGRMAYHLGFYFRTGWKPVIDIFNLLIISFLCPFSCHDPELHHHTPRPDPVNRLCAITEGQTAIGLTAP